MLVVVMGLAGTGKSEVGRRIAQRINAAFVDKDTISRDFTAALLKLHGRPGYDRESSEYLTQVRPLEYLQMSGMAEENLSIGRSVVMAAPFVKESQSLAWYENLLDDTELHGAALKIVWVRATPDAMRRYIVDRGAERDTWKRAHWAEYIESAKWNMPPVFSHEMIDNSVHISEGAPVMAISAIVSSWT